MEILTKNLRRSLIHCKVETQQGLNVFFEARRSMLILPSHVFFLVPE